MKNDINARVGQRLKKVREHLGFAKTKVSELIGFNNYQTLTDIEEGKRALKVWELSMLSDIYSKDSSYFIQEEEPSDAKYLVAWRGKSTTDKTGSIESKLAYLHDNYILLEELNNDESTEAFKAWEEEISVTSFELIEKKAMDLIDSLQLGKCPATGLAETIEKELNIKIIYLDMEHYGSAAASVSDKGFAIFINAKEPPWRRNFDLGHELFHFYSMNSFPIERLAEYEYNPKNNEEILADSFASALLLPKHSMVNEWAKMRQKKQINLLDFIKFAIDYGVSTQALLIRLAYLGLINREKVNKTIYSEEFKQLNKKERTGINVPAQMYSSRFIWLGIKALKNNKISKGKFCKIFDINKADFASFLAERGFSEDLIYGEDIEFNYS